MNYKEIEQDLLGQYDELDSQIADMRREVMQELDNDLARLLKQKIELDGYEAVILFVMKEMQPEIARIYSNKVQLDAFITKLSNSKVCQ